MADLYIGRLPGKLSVCGLGFGFYRSPGGFCDGAIIGEVAQWLLREEHAFLGLILRFCFVGLGFSLLLLLLLLLSLPVSPDPVFVSVY
ncbi:MULTISPECIES: hypothetical protein [unclassified Caballeronia]|uniref:hypothetical protein n=1 Tax=unclassified Caballeronia TaxID=2646786 RepID=UPI0020296CA1|nr:MULTISPECIES: hypothetical protein [unclassified Caballeronia]MDR5786107.1 hypothetical protein [Caballeronia sp. LP003]